MDADVAMGARPDLSICVPTWNRAPLLEALLEHLNFVHSLPFSVEIVICDNCSTDGTADLVERYQSRLPIRFFSQPANLGAMRNINAALRSARGRYTVYLADDDRLAPDILTEYMAWLEEHPDVVMLQAPWLLWDEETDTTRGTFYRVDRVTVFDQKSARYCLEFLLSRTVLPEHALYRTEALHRLVHLPHSLYMSFVMVFRAFLFGNVAFHPEPYYHFIVRRDGGVTDDARGQLGHRQALSFLDEYRGSLELSFVSALRGNAPLPVSQALKDKTLSLINNFSVDRLKVASNLSLASRDFIAAHEFKQRAWLWCDQVSGKEVLEWEQQFLPLIALQSVIEVLLSLAELRGLVLCGFAAPEGLLPGFDYFSNDVLVEVRSLEEAECAEDREQYLHLVEQPQHSQRLIAAGLLPGRVLCFADVKEQVSVLPRRFSR